MLLEKPQTSQFDETPVILQEYMVNDPFLILEEKLNNFGRLIGEFCPGEVPDTESIIRQLDEIISSSESIDPQTLSQIAKECKTYVKQLTSENSKQTKPIEEGLLLLKSILKHLKQDKPFVFDYSDVIALLKTKFESDKKKPDLSCGIPKVQVKHHAFVHRSLTDDEIEILSDFITEALENLESIEVHLIDLEQDPANADIINNIFRSFHTIKGVSGFLSLNKINTLSHTTENLLDSARSGEFLIDEVATDAILKSVDTLKDLIQRIDEGIQEGMTAKDDDIDVDDLINTLQRIQKALSLKDRQPLGEILIQKGDIDENSINEALEKQQRTPEKKIGEILVAENKLEPDQIDQALKEQTKPRHKVAAQVKVSTQKLDDLVDYAGELVIAQSMLRQKAKNDSSFGQSISHLGQIVTKMQNIAMSMRMIPIKTTFMKMIRLVRDLSRKSGKQVELQMTGADTEIDRNVVDALYEPMVHMIRNSVDHGIETEPERINTGKPDKGRIDLRAYHKGGHIIIEIQDDGKGLDKDQILKKAIATGLISGDEQLTDGQIFELILEPGFSTAKKITDVSGRGVGMDVVKEGIERFRGHLNIDSNPGKGTTFTISLPLTLAIIDGMLVRAAKEKYVIPTTAIQRAFKPGKNEYFTVEGKGEMIKDRGRLLPLIRLNEIYGHSDTRTSMGNCLVVVVESKNEKRGLLIDELLGKDEFVIKSLGSNLENVEGLAGGAILANGKVGLILDIHGLFAIAAQD